MYAIATYVVHVTTTGGPTAVQGGVYAVGAGGYGGFYPTWVAAYPPDRTISPFDIGTMSVYRTLLLPICRFRFLLVVRLLVPSPAVCILIMQRSRVARS